MAYASDPAPQDPQAAELPPEPSKKHIEEAEEQLRQLLKDSADYVDQQIPKWRFAEEVVENRRSINRFNYDTKSGGDIRDTSRLAMGYTYRKGESKRSNWHADFVVSGSSLRDQYVQGLLDVIFAFDDYIRVVPAFAQQGASIDAANFPTSKKFEKALLSIFRNFQLPTRIHELANHEATFGPCIGKMQYEQYGDMQGPSIRVVNPARFLPDPFASVSDPQQWRGVGDRKPVSIEWLKYQFKLGNYRLNKDKVEDRVGEWGSTEADDAAQIVEDATAYENDRKAPGCLLWDWHGQLYFSDTAGPVESVATFVTNRKDPKVDDGVLIRLQEFPVIGMGMRPYMVGHFSPAAGPLCEGIIVLNKDLIYYLSHLIAQFVDGVRITGIPQIICRKGTETADDLESEDGGDAVRPGKIWYVDDPSDVQALQFAGANLSDLVAAIQTLDQFHQRNTSVSDLSRGAKPTRMSATQAAGMLNRAAQPINSQVRDFHLQVLHPFGRMAMRLFQQNYPAGPLMLSRDGQPIPDVLTEEELRTGEYEIEWALNLDDQSRVARGQLLQNLFQAATANEVPMLALEGTKINRAGWIRAIMRLAHIHDPIELIDKASDDEVNDRLMKIAPPEMLLRMGLLPPPMPMPEGGNGAGPPPTGGPPSPEQLPNPEEPAGPSGIEGNPIEEALQQLAMAAQMGGEVPPGFAGGG